MNATENLMKTKLTSHSKYLRKLYIASLSAAMLTVQVRHASAQTEQDMIEVARSVVAADRKAVVVAAMQLTEKEGKSFWPLYDDYRNEMGKITDDRIKLIRDYAKLYPTVPDKQAKQMLDTYTRLQRKQVDKRAAYLKNFVKILPPAKALRFAQVETRLDLVYQLQLAAAVPSYELISLETAESLANFKEDHFEMSAKVDAIAAAEGAALNAKYREGVIVFTLPRSGLMAQAAIGGQKFSYKPLE